MYLHVRILTTFANARSSQRQPTPTRRATSPSSTGHNNDNHDNDDTHNTNANTTNNIDKTNDDTVSSKSTFARHLLVSVLFVYVWKGFA